MKSGDIEKIKRNREYFLRFHNHGVPVFKSVLEAVDYLENLESGEETSGIQ